MDSNLMDSVPPEKWENYDLLVKEIPGFRLCDFTMVQELIIRNGLDRNGCYNCTVELHLGRDYNSKPAVIVCFLHASALKIRETHQICGLEVLDARGLQWDRVRFKVHDYEHDAIELYCYDVEFDWKK